jgi:ribosomal protein L21E
MGAGLRIGPFHFGRRDSRKRAARENGAGQAKQARPGNPVHTYTGTVTGQEPGCVTVRVTSGTRGADRALIGAAITVRTHQRFPVWSAVEVQVRAADQSPVSIEQVS